MTIYLINLAIVTICSLLADNIVRDKYINGKRKYNWLFLGIALISLILVSGLRYKVGTDYYQYSEIYTFYGNDPINWLGEEVGFDALNKILYKINTNPQFFFLVTSMFINVGVVIFIKSYSINLPMSMYFYITNFTYYLTMNGIRQYIAAIILALGFKFVLNKEFKKYLIVILIASLFHASVFIMIPLYFIGITDIKSIGNKLFAAFIALAFIFYQPFVNIMFKVLENTSYAHYQSEFANLDDGANILRLVIWALPIILVWLRREKMKEIYGNKSSIIFNFCFYGMCFMALAYRHKYFARVCMYFDIYYLLLFPMIIKLFTKKENRIIAYGMVVGYFLYSTILLSSGEAWIAPYQYNTNLF